MKIWYVGLEPYASRYTLQLTDWTEAEFKRLEVPYEVVKGQRLLGNKLDIEIGQALDAHGRPYYAMSQIMWLIERLYNGEIKKDDWLYFEDMFHPGIESLFYVLAQIPEDKRPYIGMKNQANTIDPDDFTNYLGMSPWMREYERMVIKSIDCLFVNSPEMVNFAVAAGWREEVDMALVGHFVHPAMVRGFLDEPVIPWHKREDRVIFASRLVAEKQPRFFLDVAHMLWEDPKFAHVKFEILSGTSLASSEYFDMVTKWADSNRGRSLVYQGLTKLEYYHILNQSKVMFNCAYQDWVSYVMLEGSALGMNVLFPAYRSFPRALNSSPDLLYIPRSIDDAVNKLKKLLVHYYEASQYPSIDNFKAVERTVDVMRAYSSWEVSDNTGTTSRYLLPKTTQHRPGEAYAIRE